MVLESSRSASSRICSSHVNASFHSTLAFACLWPDQNLHELILQGVKPMGSQEKIGIYRNKVTMMNDKEFQQNSGKGDDISDQVILNFYNLATGRLLTALEVS